MESEAPAMVAVLGTFAVNAGIASMMGCVAIVAWACGRSSAGPRAMHRRHARGLVLSSGWTMLALAFDLWRRSAEAAGVPLFAASDATMTMLSATHYGHAWMCGMAGAVLIAATARRRFARHEVLTTIASIIGLGVLVYTRSIVSHADGDGDLSLAIAVDCVHLATVSSWAGAVWVSAFAMRRSIDDDEALSWLRTLSTIATVALATILLTGLANTWRAAAGSLPALWGSSYGTTLAAKVALVLCAAALGGVNRWIFLPRLPAPAARRAFATALRIEAVVLASVLMLAALLSNLEPPGSM